jgi:hypothetical protein
MMKKQAYTMIAMIVLVGSLAISAKAQTNGRMALIANIPFQFSIGNKSLPAGEYTVQSISDDSSNVLLRMQSRDGKTSAMLLTSTVEGKALDRARLVFHRYGNQYFFTQAWVDGHSTGLEARKSRAERAAERELTAIKMATESVAVTARR